MILNKSANFDFKQTTVSIPQIGMIIYVILQSLSSLAQKRFNPYLGDFGTVKERHFWTENPELLFLLLKLFFCPDRLKTPFK